MADEKELPKLLKKIKPNEESKPATLAELARALESSEGLKLSLALVILVAVIAGIIALFGAGGPVEKTVTTANATPTPTPTQVPEGVIATPAPAEGVVTPSPTPGLTPQPTTAPTPTPSPTPDLSRCMTIANPIIREACIREATGK